MIIKTTPHPRPALPRIGHEIPDDGLWKWWKGCWYLPSVPEITVQPVRIGAGTLWHTCFEGQHVKALDYARTSQLAREMAYEHFDTMFDL
ncbi:MAG: hypothetical protein IJ523_10410 [Succinivibrionaceae bacterium]|nr:hypothetical protein [Succinivibrionaceae bacterium]